MKDKEIKKEKIMKEQKNLKEMNKFKLNILFLIHNIKYSYFDE